jgi:DNA helicase-2/ATP-dependent DNA helicase PcrA
MTRRDASSTKRLPRLLADDIQQLDADQQAAVTTPGNLVMIAGPGSGKTRTLVARAGYLLSTDVSPLRGLAAITYTNQAALEMQQRLARLGISQPQRLFAGTIHSFCLSQVLPYAGLVGMTLPPVDKLMTTRESAALRDDCAAAEGANKWALREVFPSLRRRVAAGEDVSREVRANVAAVRRYEHECDRLAIWDFDGVLLKTVILIRDFPAVLAVVKAKYPALLIDEYQDLGATLHRLVESLADAGIQVTAVGDADQSMYGFTGGDPRYLHALSSRSDFEVVRLVTNYRCGSAVIAAAEVALAEPRGWQADPRRSDPGTIEIRIAGEGSRLQAQQALAAVQEFLAVGVQPHEIAVLLRFRNPLAPLICDGLTALGVQVRLDSSSTSPQSILGKWIASCALYAIQFAQWQQPDLAARPSPSSVDVLLGQLDRLRSQAGYAAATAGLLERIRSLHMTLTSVRHRRGQPDVPTWTAQVAGDLGLRQLANYLGDNRNRDDLDALLNAPAGQAISELADDLTSTGRVTVGTYHGAKGRTFSAVLLPALTEGVVPTWARDFGRPVPPPAALVGEERRYFYVALTRSRGSVLIHAATSGIDNRGDPVRQGYSRFALELAQQLGVRLP